MKDLYAVSDVHGRPEELRKALFSAGLFDNHGLKDPQAYILQIGDLANCVRDSIEGDRECLDMVGREIDAMLIGNHEIPYFDSENRFAGFHFDSYINDQLHSLDQRGLIWPAHLHGETLITHAGVSASQLPIRFLEDENPAWGVQSYLEGLWADSLYSASIFSDCGKARYGTAKIGGILWCDFDREFGPTAFPQIVGHTPGGLRMRGNALCIDTGAKYGGIPTVLKVS